MKRGQHRYCESSSFFFSSSRGFLGRLYYHRAIRWGCKRVDVCFCC